MKITDAANSALVVEFRELKMIAYNVLAIDLLTCNFLRSTLCENLILVNYIVKIGKTLRNAHALQCLCILFNIFLIII